MSHLLLLKCWKPCAVGVLGVVMFGGTLLREHDDDCFHKIKSVHFMLTHYNDYDVDLCAKDISKQETWRAQPLYKRLFTAPPDLECLSRILK